MGKSMRRPTLGKTLAGLALTLFALEAASQSKDEALASIGDNSNEPSGWMRLEVAIFVDTSDETLASELWEVDPELGYPSNRRWLTDYAEIKVLMDEWGEEAVNIYTDGGIAVVPAPPPQSNPIDLLDLTDNSQDRTEPSLGSSQAMISDTESLVFATGNSNGDALPADPDLLNAVFSETGSDGNTGISPTKEFATTSTGAGTENFLERDSLAIGKAEWPQELDASNRAEGHDAVTEGNFGSTTATNEQQPLEPKQLPMENLQIDNLQVADSDADKGADAISVASAKISIEALQASIDTALSDKGLADESAALEAIGEQSNGNLEDFSSNTAASELVSPDLEETSEDTGNFFAIQGLGEDFNGSASGDYDPSVSGDDSLSNETIDWLSDFDNEASDEGVTFQVEPTPPALPASYETLSLEMLPAGLKKLENETGRRPVSVISWLQPADGDSSSVIVDTWAVDGTFPTLQGTVEISRAGNEAGGYQLTTNLWANTTANYLPDKLPAIEIPTAPTRVLVIETEEAVNEEVGQANAESIDISTSVRIVTPSPVELKQGDRLDSEAIPTPQLKHAISLNETRGLREGYVRYIDHPVIQVAAVWRELTFAELYELGEAQRVRKDIDKLTRSLISQQPTKSPENSELETKPLTQ